MNKQTRTVKQRLSGERIKLPHLVETAEKSGRRDISLSIMIVLFPYLLLLGLEIGTRITDPPIFTLYPPWKPELDSPYPPLSQYAWTGDLKRMATLPYYDKLIEKSPFEQRYAHRITDEWGFVNKPTGSPPSPIDKKNDIIITGTSYMAEGSTIEYTIASQLEDLLSEPVYNASWPSGGPLTGIVNMFTNSEFFKGDADLIILGIIQRYLYSYHFNVAFERINEEGEIIPAAEPQDTGGNVVWKIIEFRSTLEKYLESTSQIRKWALRAGHFLPPMAFDVGINTQVRLAWLRERENAPILFYPGDIRSTYHSYEMRKGDKIVKALERIHQHCQKINVKLLIIFVPDKYEIYRKHVTPKLYPKRNPDKVPKYPDKRAPAVLVENLHKKGIDAIDLYNPLYKAQFKNGSDRLLYWVDDTHWSDAGIRVAAEHVAGYIKENYPSILNENRYRYGLLHGRKHRSLCAIRPYIVPRSTRRF